MTSQAAFVARFGHLFEHSPWVVERAYALAPPLHLDGLHAAFMTVIAEASDAERLQLVRAHPQLADKTAIAAGLTADSAAEQASAGLDRLTPEEYAAFHDLNGRYLERFGFPFIICVRLHDKAGILAHMRERLAGEPAAELAEALAQVGLISRLRLGDVL
jgi:2-oxo-4-hydroxy-4-carboxy-5-ureidoimidazoline decarboxylase